ncbi:MAG: indolepyruvate oxidoreductase subunit beta [bacterium]|jgi:indolepyruvate ferredoxin oxidoreductase beta subunit|nr:indolepyruvate oxidoreductase subunit beta [bacterium]MDD3806170.1 indolepyruvate oxidoreductase subunit beta [bacterium]MDD4152787.1 indolepyruvate oxidoreductase subunit beta [bacterium]MDD4558705.1 indolepyruvate oxidoreductase subunit beta [bacterium]
MSKVINITFAGVGGQGILLASDMTANALISAGYDVKQSEIHGMSQRGGSVVSDLRFGRKVYSPLIPKGETNILIAFERLEGLRSIPLLRQGGIAVVNDESILPVGCSATDYPADALERIAAEADEAIIVNATEMATRAGNVRAANMVLMGILSCLLPVKEDIWLSAIRERFNGKISEINEKAFNLGREHQVMAATR